MGTEQMYIGITYYIIKEQARGQPAILVYGIACSGQGSGPVLTEGELSLIHILTLPTITKV